MRHQARSQISEVQLKNTCWFTFSSGRGSSSTLRVIEKLGVVVLWGPPILEGTVRAGLCSPLEGALIAAPHSDVKVGHGGGTAFETYVASKNEIMFTQYLLYGSSLDFFLRHSWRVASH